MPRSPGGEWSIAIANHSLRSAEVVSTQQLTTIVPVLVAIMVWVDPHPDHRVAHLLAGEEDSRQPGNSAAEASCVSGWFSAQHPHGWGV